MSVTIPHDTVLYLMMKLASSVLDFAIAVNRADMLSYYRK